MGWNIFFPSKGRHCMIININGSDFYSCKMWLIFLSCFSTHINAVFACCPPQKCPIRHHLASAVSYFHPSVRQPTRFSVLSHCLHSSAESPIWSSFIYSNQEGDNTICGTIYRMNKGAHFCCADASNHCCSKWKNTTLSCCADARIPSATQAVLSCDVGAGLMVRQREEVCRWEGVLQSLPKVTAQGNKHDPWTCHWALEQLKETPTHTWQSVAGLRPPLTPFFTLMCVTKAT